MDATTATQLAETRASISAVHAAILNGTAEYTIGTRKWKSHELPALLDSLCRYEER